MRWFTASPIVSTLLLTLGLASGVQAEPAMFEFIMHAGGVPIKPHGGTPAFYALPIGQHCGDTTPTASNYCSPAVLTGGAPATGTTSVSFYGSVGAKLAFPSTAFQIAATGSINAYSYHPNRQTYAALSNAAATFTKSGGPAAGKGTVSWGHVGGWYGAKWIIHEGPNAFGGAMGVLGYFGGQRGYHITPHPGYFLATTSWNMVRALGRSTADPLNPFTNPTVFRNTINSDTFPLTMYGYGTPWTTGSVTVYIGNPPYGTTTTLRAAGFDSVTPGGVRNLQLVTPSVTHWHEPSWQVHSGHIGILTIQVPEPHAVLLLMAGAGALVLLRRLSRRG